MKLRTRSPSLIGALLFVSLGSPAQAADPALGRILMLPLADRTTIVAELTGSVTRVAEVDAGPETVLIEVGPVQAGVRPLDLTPRVPSMFVGQVSLRGSTGQDGKTYIHMGVTLRAPCAHFLRVVGSRLYVDFAPPEDRSPAAQPPVATRSSAAGEPSASARPPRPADERSEDTIESAYRALESSALRSARELAARPNVKALLRLHDDVVNRDNQLGHRRPEIVQHVVNEVLRYTEEARALQLERDRSAFLKAR